jgi:phospholipase/carboxylesterase
MLDTDLLPAREKGSRRLLIALHGLGDSMEGYRWLPQVLQLPWLNFLLVNAPQAYYGGYSWYDFAVDPGPGIERSRRLLFDLLDRQRDAGYPTDQTVMFGFSQGCLMTIEVGVRYSHRFASLVGISGYTHEPEKIIHELSPVAREQRFLLTHGSHDPLIPMASALAGVTRLKEAGLHIQWHEFPKEHTIVEEELQLVREFILHQFQQASTRSGS